LKHNSVDGEQRTPDQRCGQPVDQAEESCAGDRQQDRRHHQPANCGERQGRILRLPAGAGPSPRRAEHAEPHHHRDDESQLLDHLACVLQSVDEEAEYEPWHDRQERLIEQLWERPHPQEFGEVHQGDQHEAGQQSPSEAQKSRVTAR